MPQVYLYSLVAKAAIIACLLVNLLQQYTAWDLLHVHSIHTTTGLTFCVVHKYASAFGRLRRLFSSATGSGVIGLLVFGHSALSPFVSTFSEK